MDDRWRMGSAAAAVLAGIVGVSSMTVATNGAPGTAVLLPWLLPLLLLACGAEDRPASPFVASEELFVSGGAAAGFGRITALAVDEYDRAYVADRLTGTVHVLGPDGTPMRRLGRTGDGPGELQNPLGLAFGPDGRLWIVDVGRSRYVVYDTTGSFVAEWPRNGAMSKRDSHGGARCSRPSCPTRVAGCGSSGAILPSA